MSWASKTFKKAKKWVGKHSRELVGGMTFGASEFGRELSGYNQMKQMEEMADQQARMQQKQLDLARQEAGAQVQQTNAGTQQALAKVLAKRTALQRTIRTGGQQRLGD